MTVITNAELVLKDSHGNIGTVKSVTDNDIAKIRNAITDIGKLVDPVSHLPIKATATTVGVVQLADAEAIAAGTTGRVVDAKQLQDAVMGVTPANCVTNVAAGSTANKIKVTKDDYTTTITIDNVEHASFADQADTAASANSVAWDNVSDKPSSYTPASHTHDDRYYTESEIDAKLTDYLPLAGGNVTGNLSVQNKNVVRTINDVEADVNGNVVIKSNVITGALLPFAGSVIPDGYLLCNGAEVLKDDYSELYSVIGDTYGTASSSDKFKLPDFRDRFMQGANSNLGTYLEAGLPNITGHFYYFSNLGSQVGNLYDDYGGAFFNRSKDRGDTIANGGNYANTGKPGFDASRSNSIYGKSNTVQPPSLAVNILIKY